MLIYKQGNSDGVILLDIAIEQGRPGESLRGFPKPEKAIRGGGGGSVEHPLYKVEII